MYLGNQPALSYTSFAKQDFTTSATTSYTLDHPVTNENEIALFINFVRQEPSTAYSASNTNLTLTSATSASDDMYCVFLGKAVQTVNPPSGSVGTAQIADLAVTSGKMFSGFTNGIVSAQAYGLNGTFTPTATDVSERLTSWTHLNSNPHGQIGTLITDSSGVFSFGETGKYYIQFNATLFRNGGNIRYGSIFLYYSDNGGSTYTQFARATDSVYSSTSYWYGHMATSGILNVTNTTNFKLSPYFRASETAGGLMDVDNSTNLTFIKLG